MNYFRLLNKLAKNFWIHTWLLESDFVSKLEKKLGIIFFKRLKCNLYYLNYQVNKAAYDSDEQMVLLLNQANKYQLNGLKVNTLDFNIETFFSSFVRITYFRKLTSKMHARFSITPINAIAKTWLNLLRILSTRIPKE